MNPSNEPLDQALSAAAEAQRAGRFADAIQFARRALSFDSVSVPARFILGVALARSGEFEPATDELNEILATNPNSFEVLISLSTLYRDRGINDLAVELSLKAVTVRPNEPQAHNNLGRSLLAMRRLDDAGSAFGRAIALQPSFAAAHHNRGKTLQLQGKDGEAAKAYGKAARLSPTVENLLAYGQILITLCDYEGALACARHAVSSYPNSAAAHLLLCGALTENHEISAAEAHLQRAIELDPDGLEAYQTATRQRPLGYIEEANANLRLALSRNPRLIPAFDALMQNTKVTEADRGLVEAMASLLAENSLSQTELVSMHYGLGKAFEDLGEFGPAFHHYDEANRYTRQIKFGDIPFNSERNASQVTRLIHAVPANSDTAEPSPLFSTAAPIVIVGMMRSGTSLTEQIISSHPEVGGAGEQLFWSQRWQEALAVDPDRVDANKLCELGHEYVAHLQTVVQGAKRITDKMPGNYMFAGLINRAMPNARIIHIRRMPIDTCISIWATPNHMPHDGGNKKEDIVFVYRQYLRLMEHWRNFLPSHRFLEVDYEELVSQPEAVIRRMLDFCDLEWDEACLHPQQTKRLVATPSAWQVRQPLYRTSIERWRKFEPWLGPFAELVSLAHAPVQRQVRP